MEKLNGVGLALAGGGYKSFAQAAAMEEMEKANIPIAAVAGTSAGSLIACLVAGGLKASEIKQILIDADKRMTEAGLFNNMKYHLYSLFMSSGLISYETMKEQAQATLKEAGIESFSDLKMPIAIPSVDLMSGELVVFTNEAELFKSPENKWRVVTGDLDLASCVTASGAYPLAISPCRYLEGYYIDGGCRMNLPAPLFNKDYVDGVVGVSMTRPLKQLEPSDLGTFTIIGRTIASGMEELDCYHSKACDLLINLPVNSVDSFDSGSGEIVIKQSEILLASHPVDWSPIQNKIHKEENTGFVQSLKNFFEYK